MQKKYKLVLFDFDGTLADSFNWFMGTVNTVADKYGFKRIETQELDTLRGLSSRQLIAHLGMPMWKVPMVAREMRQLAARNIADIPLFDGVGRLLAQMHACEIGMGVVTTNSRDNVLRVLGSENAERVRYFECGGSLFGKAARFRKILKRSGATPSEVLCVGDEIRDAHAAAEAGLDFAGVAWGYTRPDALRAHSVRPLFKDVEEMRRILCSAGGAGVGRPSPPTGPLHQ
jgi:phosphoglycolate phosphatase